MIGRIGVVIPARDEAERIDACLDSVLLAASSVSEVVQIVVVADGCLDDTAARARRHPGVVVVETESANVGMARRVGTRHAMSWGSQWLANTDADSVVPPHWLAVQLELARTGADAVVGTVRPDFAELTPAQQQAWIATHSDGQAIGNVHGANLGVGVRAYRRAGGYPPVREHEDVDLVARLRRVGRVVATDACEVVTSGRLVGRTPGGYAGYLRKQLERASPPQDSCSNVMHTFDV